MRKISLLLVICLLMACLVACNGNKNEGTDTTETIQTTTGTSNGGNGSNESNSDEPAETEAPQDNWTQRY